MDRYVLDRSEGGPVVRASEQGKLAVLDRCVSDLVRIYVMDKIVWAIYKDISDGQPIPTLVEPISMGRCVWARCRSTSGGAWAGSQTWPPASASP